MLIRIEVLALCLVLSVIFEKTEEKSQTETKKDGKADSTHEGTNTAVTTQSVANWESENSNMTRGAGHNRNVKNKTRRNEAIRRANGERHKAKRNFTNLSDEEKKQVEKYVDKIKHNITENGIDLNMTIATNKDGLNVTMNDIINQMIENNVPIPVEPNPNANPLVGNGTDEDEITLIIKLKKGKKRSFERNMNRTRRKFNKKHREANEKNKKNQNNRRKKNKTLTEREAKRLDYVTITIPYEDAEELKQDLLNKSDVESVVFDFLNEIDVHRDFGIPKRKEINEEDNSERVASRMQRNVNQPASECSGEGTYFPYETGPEGISENEALLSYISPAKNANPITMNLWHKDMLDGDLSDSYTFEKSFQGQGVDIYVFDTGVSPNLTQHFGTRVTLTEGSCERILTTYADANCSNDRDGNNHGTICSAFAAGKGFGTATEANIISVKVCDDDGLCPYSALLDGIDWAVTRALSRSTDNSTRSVFSVSLGQGDYPSNASDPYGSRPYYNIYKNLFREIVVDLNIPVFVAAGNAGWNAFYFAPANVEEVFTVGSYRTYNKTLFRKSDASCFGFSVDMYAPGEELRGVDRNGNLLSRLSGTSFATPMVAGLAATYLSKYPSATSQEVYNHLLDNAIDYSFDEVAYYADLYGWSPGSYNKNAVRDYFKYYFGPKKRVAIPCPIARKGLENM